MEFEWDDAKAASNLRKRGVRFEDAIEIFDDPDAVERAASTVGGEVRLKRTGLAEAGPILTIIYTWRMIGGSEVARIISGRRVEEGETGLWRSFDTRGNR